MSSIKWTSVCVGLLAVASHAQAGMQITEWMYQGTALSGVDAEFVEFTNIGGPAVDLTGWSFDDSSATPGAFSLSAFGVVQPGESVILCGLSASAFRTNWGLDSSVKVIGGNTENFGRGDTFNLFDASDALVETLSYGDQDYPGTVRTQLKSCNVPANGYGFTAAQLPAAGWVLASIGDAYGSWQGANNDIASPGLVPEPATLILFVLGMVGLVRRRR